ncbi:hypothetical protein [Vibrio vulnificus YJ016]|uniref:Outer membrane protein beta-barrel domain-containing protein n=2 Tax=Vibrio vulnificus TaxID=672 RepID=Q7ME49_VIBVY|nr:hypothetical protein [Vibrio vulnificus]EKA7348882.1 hypothetical protein [Vibrio vulnificus]MBN8120492.1 hypothetical protein [Vibrio vulnificus]MCJ0820177.1 porin family protein [Vibrio vulnificus]MCU8217770.1 porin family protein [Vibrio vulnificus]BAC96861.1 hypothetical protein [Vibrio vulnificus YJ016]
MKRMLWLLPFLSTFAVQGAEYSIGLSGMGGEIDTMAVTFGARASFDYGINFDTVVNVTNRTDKIRTGMVDEITDYGHLNIMLMPSYRFEPFERVDFIVRAGAAFSFNKYDYRENVYNSSGSLVDVRNKRQENNARLGFAYGAALQYHIYKEEDLNVSLGLSYDVTDFGEVDDIDFGSGSLIGGYVSVGF